MQKEKLRSFEIVLAEISFLAHATEDMDRMLNLVSLTLIIDKEKFESRNLLGHWGNQINMVKGKLEGKMAGKVANTVFTSLDTYDRRKMLYSMADYVDDKGTIHLRFDKQKICEGIFVLSEIDSIKMKFKPRLFFSRVKQDYVREYRGLLGSND
jgi:RNA binding exosome subunit